MQTDRTIVVNSLDEALAQTLKQLIEDGSKVAISDPLSTRRDGFLGTRRFTLARWPPFHGLFG